MTSPLSLIIQREYLERVKRKSFIIVTILVPILMLAMMGVPTLIMYMSSPAKTNVIVVDRTGRIFDRLEENEEISFKSDTQPLDRLKADEANEAILILGEDAVENPDKAITLYTRRSLSMMTDLYIQNQLRNAIQDVRLEAYNISNIREILREVEPDVQYATILFDNEEEKETSSSLSYILGMAMDLMLYMFILLYGQMVMTSIIEEKNNRVLEIIVSSVKPSQLMLGKILGVGLVAITQILIWAVLIGTMSAVGMPLLMGSDVMTDAPTELSGAVTQLADPSFMLTIFITTVLYFIGGFLFYASIYAAIGSAVSNIQDASQLANIATIPVIAGILFSLAILNNPTSTLAFWISIIPFTSPMAMMTRVPFGVPFWELALSIALLYASFIFMIWLCQKIYRVGIFMHGKKPNLTEIIRWARYK